MGRALFQPSAEHDALAIRTTLDLERRRGNDMLIFQ